MGSNSVEVTAEFSNSLHVLQGSNSSVAECSIESVVTVNSSADVKSHMRTKPENDTTTQPKFTVWRVLELSLLSIIIVTVWGLLALPTVFFHMLQQQQVNASSENTTATAVANCSAVVYRGETCRGELLAWQACLTGRHGSQEVHIPQDINQEETELQAYQLLTVGLSFLQTSEECEAAVQPFLCLYLFGLCDSGSGQVYQPSFTECVTLMTKTCAREWQIAINTQLGQTLLPRCESLPDDHAEDCTNGTTNSDASEISEPSQTQTTEKSTTTLLNSSRGCSDGFYLDLELDVCRPQCGIWKPTSHASQAVIDAFTITALCTAVICGSAFLILALFQRKQMFTFPKVIFVYINFALVVGASVLLTGCFDREGLFCSSVDLIESVQNPTPFCKLSAVIYTYFLIQVVLGALFYCFILFWATVHPFHFGNFKTAGRLVYVHITMVIIEIVLPCVPTFVGLSTGYSHGILTYSYICTPANPDVSAYTVLLPVSISIAGSVSMLMVIFWTLFKQYMKNKGKSLFVTAEKKILIILLYYTLMTSTALVPFAHSLITRQQTEKTLQNYFLCEGSRSKQPDLDCNVQELVATQLPGLHTVTIVMQGLLPAFLLILFVNPKCLKAKVARTLSC